MQANDLPRQDSLYILLSLLKSSPFTDKGSEKVKATYQHGSSNLSPNPAVCAILVVVKSGVGQRKDVRSVSLLFCITGRVRGCRKPVFLVS